MNNLDQPPHKKNFSALIASIGKKECAIFIGAGLSMAVGYPDLQKLLQKMAEEAKIPELQQKEVDATWQKDFQVIKDALGLTRYREVLRNVFDHKRSPSYNSLLINILNIPFCAFVTTNYDPCLELATSNLSYPKNSNRYSYPTLPPTQLRGEHIFHLHGYIDPFNPDSVNTIILSADEFFDAYQKTQLALMFLRALFDDLDVLFVGFGWNDIVVLSILEEIKELREIRAEVAVSKNYQLARERSKFAIIDKDTYERDKSEANYIGRLGILPIIYEKIGDSHYQLEEIVQEIQKRTSSRPIFPIPTAPPDILESSGDFHG